MTVTNNELGPVNTDLMPPPAPVQPGESGVINPVDGRLLISPESNRQEHAPDNAVRTIGSLAAQSGIQLSGFEMPGTAADPDVRGHGRDEQGNIVPLYRGADGRPTTMAPTPKEVAPGSFGPTGSQPRIPDFQEGHARDTREVPTSEVADHIASGGKNMREMFAHGVPGSETERRSSDRTMKNVARPNHVR